MNKTNQTQQADYYAMQYKFIKDKHIVFLQKKSNSNIIFKETIKSICHMQVDHNITSTI